MYHDTFLAQAKKKWKAVASDAATGLKEYCDTKADGTANDTPVNYFLNYDGTHEGCQKACIDLSTTAGFCQSYDYDPGITTPGIFRCCIRNKNQFSTAQPTVYNLEDATNVKIIHGLRKQMCKAATEITALAGKWPLSPYSLTRSSPGINHPVGDANIPVGGLTIQSCDEICRGSSTCKSFAMARQTAFGTSAA